jgi:hypothetical protein
MIFDVINSKATAQGSVTSSQHITTWLSCQPNPIQVIEKVVLPVISKECANNAGNQSLLADIVQVVQSFTR